MQPNPSEGAGGGKPPGQIFEMPPHVKKNTRAYQNAQKDAAQTEPPAPPKREPSLQSILGSGEKLAPIVDTSDCSTRSAGRFGEAAEDQAAMPPQRQASISERGGEDASDPLLGGTANVFAEAAKSAGSEPKPTQKPPE